jgi:hypothetical protein
MHLLKVVFAGAALEYFYTRFFPFFKSSFFASPVFPAVFFALHLPSSPSQSDPGDHSVTGVVKFAITGRPF